MPFLPMKFPEYRLSMEENSPSSVQGWLRKELELRGIDSRVYTRYIINLLLQDGEDLEGLETDLDSFPKSRRKGQRSGKQKRLSSSDEERKKFAAIKCLSDLIDEKSGIETLVEELCSRLKDEVEASLNHSEKSRSCSSDCSDDSSTENQNPAQRYYAAFPALHGQGVSTNLSPSETIWRKNPLVKSHTSLSSEEDSSSANEDAEIRKINIPAPVAVPKQRKPRKNSSRNRKDNNCCKREGSKSRSGSGQKGGRKAQKGPNEKQDVPSWPPGFARLDPLLMQNLDLWHEEYVEPVQAPPKRSQDDLCTKVESLLKGMLLPAPEKSYKDLQDVDDSNPEELRQKFEKKAHTVMAKSDITAPANSDRDIDKGINVLEMVEDSGCADFSDVIPPSPREGSVSPELQEQEIWYTQPIDVIFQSQDEDEVSSSKLRLYKRNSNPAFSPDPESLSDPSVDGLPSLTPSPVDYDRNRSLSFASDKSDEILEGSLLIPSWLTEVISGDETNMDDIDSRNCKTNESFKSSSPFSESLAEHYNQETEAFNGTDGLDHLGFDKGCFDLGSNEINPRNEHYQYEDENSTPTPENVKNGLFMERSLSVSLVDWDYMSKFLIGESKWESFSPDGSFSLNNPRRACITTLWQSQVLFDYSLNISDTYQYIEEPLLEMYDLQCWQPLGSRPYSQLWDVNMQKRSKMSVWGGQVFCAESQVWFAENTLVFLHNSSESTGDNQEKSQGENTLIPRISIDIVAEEDATSFLVPEENLVTEHDIANYFDRSVSMGDVPSLWDDDNTRIPDPKLSKSFELVPSEHSAFKDVPRKLVHVHSEPNLVQYRQEFGDIDQASASSPHEHLYFSPKTHFRPITPAYVPELFTSKSKQQVCHDLFGGLPNTKTPYQQFQVADNDILEEGFIPSFKVKHYSKCIQTGESFEKVDSPADANEAVERDTPETLTLSIIEDVIEEKVDQLIMISDDLDTANTDSAYETDYGGNHGADLDHDPHHSAHCCQTASFEGDISLFGIPNVDHGHLGEIANFSVESFEATYPHTNDWPDVPPNGFHWADNNLENPLTECLTAVEHLEGEHVLKSHVGSYTSQHGGIWNDDLGLNHLYQEGEMEKYKNIWSSASNDYYSFEAGLASGTAVSEGHCHDDEDYDEIQRDEFFCNLIPESYEGNDLFDYQQGVEAVFDPFTEQLIEPTDTDLSFPTYAGFPANEGSVVLPEKTISPVEETADYFSVRLVYKKKKPAEGDAETAKAYENSGLVPMPNEAVTSTELEKEWLDPKIMALWASRKPSSLQRKPCSFYLEGNCRRADCKFAHDISNITCRFWEEGGCFKGPLCPFLHGYPRMTSPELRNPSAAETEHEKFDLNKEEFPELCLTLKNMKNNSNAVKKHKPIKPAKSDVTVSGRRERGRKANARRHSNKENRCEVKIVDTCSSSI